MYEDITTTAADDLGARLCPSAEQLAIARGIVRSHPEVSWVLVPIALPGKRRGVWEVGQPVEYPQGYFPVIDNDSEARDAVTEAAARYLAGRGGVTAYARVDVWGDFAVFEDLPV